MEKMCLYEGIRKKGKKEKRSKDRLIIEFVVDGSRIVVDGSWVVVFREMLIDLSW